MILDRAEAMAALGIADSATDKQKGLLNILHPAVERAIKRKLRNNIEQATYTEYLHTKLGQAVELDGLVDLIGDRVTVQGRPWYPSHLQLTQIPVRSVTSVYEDPAAWAGTNPQSFPPATQLVEGVHFYRDLNKDGLCRSGKLIRIAGSWCSRERSIKVTYIAGYARNELDGNVSGDTDVDASDLKLGVLLTLQHNYEGIIGSQGQPGAIVSENLGGYSVTYSAELLSKQIAIPPAALELFEHFLNYSRLI